MKDLKGMIDKVYKIAVVIVLILLIYTVLVKDSASLAIIADLFWKIYGAFAITGGAVKIAGKNNNDNQNTGTAFKPADADKE